MGSSRRLYRSGGVTRPSGSGGTTNLLLGKVFTSSAGTVAGFPLSNLNDTNPATRWISNATDNVSITADLGAIYDLSRIVLVLAGDTVKNYHVQLSRDAASWSTIASGVSMNTATETADIVQFSASGTGRYLRVVCVDRWNASYGNSLWEIEAYGLLNPTQNPRDDTPTNLTATARTDTQITIEWDAPANPNGAIQGYHVYIGGNKVTASPISARTYTATGLSENTPYMFTVKTVVGGAEAAAASISTSTLTATPAGEPSWPFKISANGRYIVGANDVPFVWQADTAWELLEATDRAEVQSYVTTRKNQGFTVSQISLIPHVEDSNALNQFGDYPFNGTVANPITTPGNNPSDGTAYDYWDHVDYTVNLLEANGIYAALLPVWGRTMVPEGHINASNAQGYGQFVGSRYKNNKIIWILGGDLKEQDAVYSDAIWDNLARGIAIGINGSENYDGILMTFHPGDAKTDRYHNKPWFSFYMEQSGHCNGNPYNTITLPYARTPAKPVLNGEPYYEDHPRCWNPANGYSTPQQVRNDEYISVFAGAFGFTYGNQCVWQMYEPGRNSKAYAQYYWYDAITHTAATQMIHLRTLISARPIVTRIPDQSIANGNSVVSTRDSSGSYLMVYAPSGGSFSVNTSILSGSSARGWWYNPRTGASTSIASVAKGSGVSFNTPTGEDWVLVIDDASKGFTTPS